MWFGQKMSSEFERIDVDKVGVDLDGVRRLGYNRARL